MKLEYYIIPSHINVGQLAALQWCSRAHCSERTFYCLTTWSTVLHTYIAMCRRVSYTAVHGTVQGIYAGHWRTWLYTVCVEKYIKVFLPLYTLMTY